MTSEIPQAADLLNANRLVAFPTETVYGLGGNALSDAAVAAIYAAKGRPQFNPLIVHVSSLEDAKRYAQFNDAAEVLAKRFWPGPLTLVLPRRTDCALSLLVSAGLDSVALRIPAHPLAQELLKAAQLPIAAPSANRSGRVSPTEAAHVREELGERIDMVLDGGPCRVGIESTVVDMTGAAPIILRPGAIILPPPIGGGSGGGHNEQERNQLCPHPDPSPTGEGMRSPGMLPSHYAPSCPVRLDATGIRQGEGLLAFGPVIPEGAVMVENLSEKGDLQEAAVNLFRMLRRLDAAGVAAIAVMPIPHEGLGIAINDRLTRAAAGK